MKFIIGIMVLLVALVAVLKMRSRARMGSRTLIDVKKAAPSATGRPKSGFHAVSIHPGVFACKAARELEGQRFLSNSAPRVPLPGCDVSDCTCRFAHHHDRREGDERRTPYPPSVGLDAGSTGTNQRLTSDRRRNSSAPE
jgi:hypothetical protein